MTPARGTRLRRALACACGLALAAPVHAHASDTAPASPTAPACAPRAVAATSPAQGWPAPLDRILALDARDVSLRDALDRVSASARIRISYSPELLPLDRRVCVAASARTVGDALAELLRDTPVEAVVAGTDHVVLALRRTRAAAADADATPPDELGRTVALSPVVVTGDGGGDIRSPRPYALQVVDAGQLAREGTAPLARFLNAASAGTWGWESAPSSLWTRFGSIRGASSFGASAPRVFIDGIEVANPLLATQIAPEAVERIEVVRGPQGAALYGTGAVSGVVNIVTRHEGTDGAPALRIRGGLGRASSDFAAGGTVAQEHAVSLRAGSRARSAGLDVGFGGVGEYVPRGGSRYGMATGTARRVASTTVLTGTARFYSARLGTGQNPLLRDLVADSLAAGRQRMTQYTLGGSLRWTPDARWTHTLVAGLDGGEVAGLADERSPVPSSLASGARWMEGGADRVTLRWSSVARAYESARADVQVMLGAEHSTLREQVAPSASALRAEGAALVGPAAFTRGDARLATSLRTTALSAQGTATLDDRLHLTGGLRVEQNGGIAGGARYAALPVLGAAWVTALGGDATLKLRAAYGKGVRPARAPLSSYGYGAGMEPLGYLAPEQQSGVEGGVDLALGDWLQLAVTAYDQLASGLVQRVARPAVAVMDGGWRDGGYTLQNVGQISNRGWEMQGTALLGRLSLEGAFASVDSRVRRLADGYTGDLRTGDRMLEVPARTLALTGAYAGDGWTASLTGTRAFDWINYDRLALARDWANGVLGADLRGYWRAYEGVTRLNATATLDVPGGVTLVLLGDNLLNHQRGEPDNLTVVPGRTLTLGVRAAF